MSVYVIAECGVNHNGDMALAHRLINAAMFAGADAVKFQLYRAELLAPEGERREMLRQYQLSQEQIRILYGYCCAQNVTFLCTPFDKESADFLDPLVSTFKIGSGQANDLDFVSHVAAKGKPILLSTGMSNEWDMRESLSIIKRHVTLLHCVSLYPTPPEKANLARLRAMKRGFSCQVGYSDHTEGIDIALAAVALGAVVIEKHLTLDKSMPGPDHKASITPAEFKQLVTGIRNIEKALS